MPKADIWMPLAIGDYLADTSHLNTIEHGAYLLLLMHYWRKGPLPNDLPKIAQIAKLPQDAWSTAQVLLNEFFALSDDGMYHQKRSDNEIAKWQGKRKKAQEKAEKAAGVRWNKNTPSIAPSTPQAVHEECPSPLPLPIEEQRLKPLVRPEEFANVWNRNRGTLPKVDRFTKSRREKVQKRMGEGITLERFTQAVACCRGKPFLRGDNDRGWVATFDWLVKNEENIEKAINNPYSGGINGNGNRGPAGKGQRAVEAAREAILDLADNEADEDSYGAAGDCGQGNAQVLFGEPGDLRAVRPGLGTRQLLPPRTGDR